MPGGGEKTGSPAWAPALAVRLRMADWMVR